MSDFRHYCSSCDLRPQCEHTFGRFFADKSSNGTGCNHKISPFDLSRIRVHTPVVKPSEAMAKNTEKTAAGSVARPSRAEILERINRMRGIGRK